MQIVCLHYMRPSFNKSFPTPPSSSSVRKENISKNFLYPPLLFERKFKKMDSSDKSQENNENLYDKNNIVRDFDDKPPDRKNTNHRIAQTNLNERDCPPKNEISESDENNSNSYSETDDIGCEDDFKEENEEDEDVVEEEEEEEEEDQQETEEGENEEEVENMEIVDFSSESEEESNEEEFLMNSCRLIVNLYAEDRGWTYSFGNSNKTSHFIDYSESSLLEAIDREEIPVKFISVLEESGYPIRTIRNHLLAEIRDYRLFQRRERKNPKIRRIVLRPSSQTILEDLKRMFVKGSQRRRGFKRALIEENEESGKDQESSNSISKSLISEEDEDLLTLDEKIELEKKIINMTAPPICLDPSPTICLIKNRAQYQRFKWNDEKIKNSIKKYKRSLDKVSIAREIAQNRIEEDQYEVTTWENGRRDFVPFLKFVQNLRETKRLPPQNNEPIKPWSCKEYPDDAPILKNHEEIIKLITPLPEPATIRPVPSEFIVHKKEEFVMETERRKKPHITKLSIFQRCDDDNYFGELEMESITDSPQNAYYPGLSSQSSPAMQALAAHSEYSGNKDQTQITKCQFELGSIRNVQLYVRQFSDIFTEDGRRPCRVTYEKIGEGPPKVIYQTPKTPAMLIQSNQPSSSATSIASGLNLLQQQQQQQQQQQLHQQQTTLPSVVSNSPSAAAISSVTNQPPVQIVHPQPRPQPQQAQNHPPKVSQVTSNSINTPPLVTSTQAQATVRIYSTSVTTTTSSPSLVVQSGNMNFNLNVKSGVVGQVLNSTGLQRPPVVLNQIQQRVQTPQQIHIPNVQTHQASHHIHQQSQQRPSIRIKQQPTLATLLLTGINPTTNQKPITMAIQQQQNSSSQSIQAQNQNTKGPLMAIQPQPQQKPITMVTIPQQQNSQAAMLNVNNLMGHHHHHHQNQQFSQHHVTNPNQMGSLIMITSSPAATATGNINQQQANINGNQVSLNLNAIGLDRLLNGPTNVGTLNAYSMNSNAILRVNNAASRQIPNTVNLMSPQGILISNNSGNSTETHAGEIEEITVPDINGFISTTNQQNTNQQPSQSQQNASNLDGGLNLNLTLNLNLSGQSQKNSNYDTHQMNSEVMSSSADGTSHQVSSSMSPSKPIAHQQQHQHHHHHPQSTEATGRNSGVITLNDLLGSNLMVVSSTNSNSNVVSQGILSSPNTILMNPSSTSSGISSTPRLSALLAGTPSADTSGSILNSNSNNISIVDSSTGNQASYGNLLDRLAYSLTQPRVTQSSISSRSGLNPIATATPNVVLEHPMLAATLTQTPPTRATVYTNYRQIAPAPAPSYSLQQPQQLINLLGIVNNNNNPQTIRISKPPGSNGR